VNVPGVILAGGRSSRMGRPKALLPVDARDTFVSRLVRTLRAAGVAEVVVVAAADGPLDALRDALAAAPPAARLALNPDASRGQLSSLLAGLAAVDRPGVDALLMTLVDVPLVGVSTVRALLDAHARSRAPVVRPVRAADDAHGHPVIFDRSLFDALRGADPRTGAKPVVRARAAEIENVPVDDPGAFGDVDTPADYRRVFGRPLSADPAPR
jgi:molybdenum cofactor cytidylyltransferase